MKTKLTKMIMSSLAFACALVCLAATMAPGTSATARAEADRHCSVGMLRGDICGPSTGTQNGWEPGTESRYARPPVQRRWYDVQSFGTVNIGGRYFRRHRIGRNLYGRSGLHGHAVTSPDGPKL